MLSTPQSPFLPRAAQWAGFAIIGIWILIFLVTAWGVWEGKKWARGMQIGLAVLGVLSIAYSPISGVISLVVLWYLWRPEAKEHFGIG